MHARIILAHSKIFATDSHIVRAECYYMRNIAAHVIRVVLGMYRGYKSGKRNAISLLYDLREGYTGKHIKGVSRGVSKVSGNG